jgi:hypothetical protein
MIKITLKYAYFNILDHLDINILFVNPPPKKTTIRLIQILYS